mgnify:CR=1 FL=1
MADNVLAYSTSASVIRALLHNPFSELKRNEMVTKEQVEDMAKRARNSTTFNETGTIDYLRKATENGPVLANTLYRGLGSHFANIDEEKIKNAAAFVDVHFYDSAAARAISTATEVIKAVNKDNNNTITQKEARDYIDAHPDFEYKDELREVTSKFTYFGRDKTIATEKLAESLYEEFKKPVQQRWAEERIENIAQRKAEEIANKIDGIAGKPANSSISGTEIAAYLKANPNEPFKTEIQNAAPAYAGRDKAKFTEALSTAIAEKAKAAQQTLDSLDLSQSVTTNTQLKDFTYNVDSSLIARPAERVIGGVKYPTVQLETMRTSSRAITHDYAKEAERTTQLIQGNSNSQHDKDTISKVEIDLFKDKYQTRHPDAVKSAEEAYKAVAKDGELSVSKEAFTKEFASKLAANAPAHDYLVTKNRNIVEPTSTTTGISLTDKNSGITIGGSIVNGVAVPEISLMTTASSKTAADDAHKIVDRLQAQGIEMNKTEDLKYVTQKEIDAFKRTNIQTKETAAVLRAFDNTPKVAIDELNDAKFGSIPEKTGRTINAVDPEQLAQNIARELVKDKGVKLEAPAEKKKVEDNRTAEQIKAAEQALKK